MPKIEVTCTDEFKEKVKKKAKKKSLSVSSYTKTALNEKMEREK